MCLLRYIGLTRESSNVRDLLHSLCTQITTALGCLPDDIPSDTNDLQRFFPKLLAAVPVDLTVVVILDAIDKAIFLIVAFKSRIRKTDDIGLIDLSRNKTFGQCFEALFI